MDQEAADELPALQDHRLLAIAVTVVLPFEPDLVVVHRQQPVVGDGDTMGIPPDVVENLRRAGEGLLRVDDPPGFPKRREVTAKRGGFMEMAVRVEEVQRTGGERLCVTSGVNLPQNHRVEFSRGSERRQPEPIGCRRAQANQGQALRVAAQVAASLDRPCARRLRDLAVGTEECSRRGSNQRTAWHSEGWMFAEQVELPRAVGVTFRGSVTPRAGAAGSAW